MNLENAQTVSAAVGFRTSAALLPVGARSSDLCRHPFGSVSLSHALSHTLSLSRSALPVGRLRRPVLALLAEAAPPDAGALRDG